MKLTRRGALQVLAGATSAALLPKGFGQVDPNAAAAGVLPTASTAPAAGSVAIPPAPLPIAAPAGFGMAAGRFQPTWDSLYGYQIPDWYRDAKLGIWAHWGPQCQPEDGDWYAQRMYNPKDSAYAFHIQKYGHPSKFGFKDVCNEWKADQWDPEHLVNLYKKAGAKYFCAMAHHHDNFDNFDSTYQPWNSVNIGPKKDILGGWEKAARGAGLKFAVSSHGDRAWSWYQNAQRADATGPLAGVPYDGLMTKEQGKGLWWEGYDPQDFYAQYHAMGKYNWPQQGEPPLAKAFIEKYFNRVIDLIDKYSPDLLYFDDTVLPIYPTSDIGLRIMAYLYNTNLAKHGKLEAVITGKGLNADQRRAMVLDVERGVTAGGETLPWQTDTCIGQWHYQRSLYEQHKYKTAKQVVQMLIDIVSKNGNLMLNIPVRGNGTIDDDELKVVEGLTDFMSTNGEAIYATRPFAVYGEGPSTTAPPPKGRFGGAQDVRPYTGKDVRYTSKGETVFAFVMGAPAEGKVTLTSLGTGSAHYRRQVRLVELLGRPGPVQFSQDKEGLSVTLPRLNGEAYAYVLKISPQ